MTIRHYGAVGAALLLCASSSAYAQNLSLIVPVGAGGSPTSPSVLRVEQELKEIPGGADVVPAKEFQEGYALSMKDMLKKSPGVLAEPRWGEESRLSIRGSGLSRGFHLRGINLLQDGIPFNFSDGSGDFQEIDPLILQHVEVYRGGNGLRYGAASLGGAINMVTPTALNLPYNVLLRTEAGSDKTLRLHARAAKDFGKADVFAATTRTSSDGFRQQSEQMNERFSGNIGYRFTPEAETRFYVAWNNLEQEVPGTISKSAALNDPTSVPAVNITGDYARDIQSLRLANRTVLDHGDGQKTEFGAYVNKKHLYHPIFQVLDQHSIDAGVFARADRAFAIQDHKNEFTLGVNMSHGENDAKRFVNVGGKRGAQTAYGTQTADNIELYGENRYFITQDLRFITGLQAHIAPRDYENHLSPSQDADKTYKSLNPKIGLLYKLNPRSEVFGSITRSSEVPTYSELVQGSIAGFVPVKLQKAWTAEVGTRGMENGFEWDVTLYHARIQDELLNYTVTADVPASTFNADETIHQGIEAGLSKHITPEISLGGTYTFNDFKFDGDTQFGDNDLAGAPPHQVKVFARYEKNGFYIEPSIDWTPKAAWVDYANTLKSDTPVIVNAKAGYDINQNVSLFFDARNLFDEKNIATFSTITDARTTSTNVFYPGDGRSVYGGVSIKF